ncbi:leucyl/phenylalanyl-tRNA--protein transferase [Coralloluteibacterium stylophorae]|uniref:Leucyl/phenylalanyl-tRNA--protein transferase n=1 Tax=Coralloluteibacterium stylophorae TaxID=1776034 RepID=A0A8J8B071_9GAMM|nr:leucyl/phenylalanyl-tRNA--protein transferase [Coralloluteibacterium stylophorae]MBS7455907.1 leucyl/phenylalanyl-tRNA--protein transferase [Coralloluteibacterium stylophorae]
MRLPILPADPGAGFPDPSRALRAPNGLLAAGGDLHPARLLDAYRHGIFPWYSEGEPVLWWSPDPRAVFEVASLRPPSRFGRTLRRSDWEVRVDTAFADVVRACATAPRPGQNGTWIGAAMAAAYQHLHRLGHAHSVEVFAGDRLVGGIYGVTIGRMFFGESMFSGVSGGSKAALLALARILAGWGWPLIDAQVENPHLRTLGAVLMPRPAFLRAVEELVALSAPAGSWQGRVAPFPARVLGLREA